MNANRERTSSIWMDTEVYPEASPLKRNATADSVVIGSGIAGLSTAYELAARGQKVVVLDRGPIAGGITARTTAHLTSLCDESFASLVDLQGVHVAKQFYESQAASIDRIEDIQQMEGIECTFRRLEGYLFPALGSDPSKLDGNLEADRKVGIPVEDRKGLPLKGLEKTRCLVYPNQATLHPLQYLRGVAQAIAQKGGALYAETCMKEVTEENGAVIVTTTDGRKISAGAAVIATNSPVNDVTVLHTKQAPYRTYAMAFELQPMRYPTRSIGIRSMPITTFACIP